MHQDVITEKEGQKNQHQLDEMQGVAITRIIEEHAQGKKAVHPACSFKLSTYVTLAPLCTKRKTFTVSVHSNHKCN